MYLDFDIVFKNFIITGNKFSNYKLNLDAKLLDHNLEDLHESYQEKAGEVLGLMYSTNSYCSTLSISTVESSLIAALWQGDEPCRSSIYFHNDCVDILIPMESEKLLRLHDEISTREGRSVALRLIFNAQEIGADKIHIYDDTPDLATIMFVDYEFYFQ